MNRIASLKSCISHCMIALTIVTILAEASLIKRVCESKLKLDKLIEFREFIEEFKKVDLDSLKARGINNLCLKQRQSILDLEEIVSVTRYVCSYEHVNKMIDYHDKYLHKKLFKPDPITGHLFKLYAVQVSYTCKMNIKKNLATAQEEMRRKTKDMLEAREAVSSNSNLKTNLQWISSQPDEPVSSNIKPKTSEELLMDEFREILTKSTRVEDVLAYKQQDCLQANSNNNKDNKGEANVTTISKKKLDVFQNSASMCQLLSRYYSGSILSLAKLANHGYMAKLDDLDQELAQSRRFKDWLIAVQVCEPLTHIRTNPDLANPDYYILENCVPDSITDEEPMIFDDHFNEIGDNIRQLAKTSDSSKDAARAKWKAAATSIMKLKIRAQLRDKKTLKDKLASLFSLIINPRRLDNDEDDSDYSDEEMEKSYISRVDVSLLRTDEVAGIQSMRAITALMPTFDSLSENDVFPGEKEVQFSFDPASYFTTLAILTAVMLAVEWVFLIALSLMARIESSIEFSDVLKFPPKFPSLRKHTDFKRVLDDYDDLDEDELIRYDELTESEKMHQKKLRKIFGRAPPAKFRC